MVRSLINNIMKSEKNPELTPIKIDAKGRISCTSGILYTLIYPKFQAFPEKTLYLDYRLFCNTIFPLLYHSPEINIHEDKLNLTTSNTSLNITTLEPFDDYVDSLKYLEKTLESVKKYYLDMENNLPEIQWSILKNMMINLTLAKGLNQYSDLFFIRYIDNKLISVSPISLMAVKMMKKIPHPIDLPGIYIQSILRLKEVNSEIYDAGDYIFTRIVSDDGEAHILCKKIYYELPDYEKYFQTKKVIGRGTYDLETINELYKLITPFESTYWISNLRLKADGKNGLIQFDSFQGRIIKKMPSSKGIYDISINSKLFRIISKLELTQITEYPDCIRFSKPKGKIIFIVSKHKEDV